jgi:hypothetical protein
MTKFGSFDPPMEPEWHRMISEAAYFRAEKRGFEAGLASGLNLLCYLLAVTTFTHRARRAIPLSEFRVGCRPADLVI